MKRKEQERIDHCQAPLLWGSSSATRLSTFDCCQNLEFWFRCGAGRRIVFFLLA